MHDTIEEFNSCASFNHMLECSLNNAMPLARYACHPTLRTRRATPALSPRHPGALAVPPRNSRRVTPALSLLSPAGRVASAASAVTADLSAATARAASQAITLLYPISLSRALARAPARSRSRSPRQGGSSPPLPPSPPTCQLRRPPARRVPLPTPSPLARA
jgi:hypothetical protein